MTQPIKIEIHLHIHADGAVTLEQHEKVFHVQEANSGGGAVAGPSASPRVSTPVSLPETTKPVESPASSSNTDAPAVEGAAAPVPPPAGKSDRNPNLLRTALYDASKRVGKDAALEVVARLAGGSLRNVTDETFDNVLNNLNALQKE